MATRKRVKISTDVQDDIRRQRSRVDYGNPGWRTRARNQLPTSESRIDPVENIQESERFSWSNPDAWPENLPEGFIPLTYSPTKTSWPGNGWDHRRTIAAGYNRETGILRVQFFTDKAVYDYGTATPVPPYVAYQFRLAKSPGRFINSTLESYGYTRL